MLALKVKDERQPVGRPTVTNIQKHIGACHIGKT